MQHSASRKKYIPAGGGGGDGGGGVGGGWVHAWAVFVFTHIRR